jgi:hypothetical protein
MIQQILKIDQALKIVDHQIPDNEVDLFYRYALNEKWGITLTLHDDYSIKYPKLFKFLYKMIQPHLL